MDFSTKAYLFFVLHVLACLTVVRCGSDRCPETSDSGILFIGSGIGVSGSSDSIGISCDELDDPEEGGILRAMNFYCRNVVNSTADCMSVACMFCDALLACEVTSETMFEVCASDLLLSCSAQPDTEDSFLDELYSNLCQYAYNVCLASANTGICESVTLVECAPLADSPYPCDCFVPNATCELCNSVLSLCPDFFGSGIDSGLFSGGSSDSGSGSGSGFVNCSYLEDELPGTLYICLSFSSPQNCPFSRSICQLCDIVYLCPDLLPPSQQEVCSNADSVLPCIINPEYCSLILHLCLTNGSGICENERVTNACTNSSGNTDGTSCVDGASQETCRNCDIMFDLCRLQPQPSSTSVPPELSSTMQPASSSETPTLPPELSSTMQPASSSEPPTLPSPTPGPATFPVSLYCVFNMCTPTLWVLSTLTKCNLHVPFHSCFIIE